LEQDPLDQSRRERYSSISHVLGLLFKNYQFESYKSQDH
jgi:hypothetical protein